MKKILKVNLQRFGYTIFLANNGKEGLNVAAHKIPDLVITDIIELLEFKDLNDSQEFAIGYLIRGLIISKITYLIEASKHR